VHVEGSILDVAMPTLRTNEQIDPLVADYIRRAYGLAFDLNIGGFSNMMAARAYKSALLDEQRQLEPYISAQTALNQQLESRSKPSFHQTWNRSRKKLSAATNMANQTSIAPAEPDFEPMRYRTMADARIGYAISVIRWVAERGLVSQFEPDKFRNALSPTEL